MKANEIWVRCQKARIVSWLNSDKVGATLPLDEGRYVLLAVYENGKYVQPEAASIPDSLPSDWVGPDGPFRIPEDDDEDDDADAEEDSTDDTD